MNYCLLWHMHSIVHQHEDLIDELTEGQIRELRRVLSYVNRYNDDNSSWLSILSTVVGDIRPANRKLYEIVEEFLKK